MLSVLHFDPRSRRLTAVDEVTLGGLGRTEVSVVRRNMDRDEQLAQAR
jgi:hypothetical protein